MRRPAPWRGAAGHHAGTTLFNLATPGFITGFFLDYWLQFATGALLYIRLCKITSPRTALGVDLAVTCLLAAVARAAPMRREFDFTLARYQFFSQWSVCLAFMLLLVLLRPWDAVLLRLAPVRLLRGVGLFSYSLYVFHQPLQKALRLFLPSLSEPRETWADPAAVVLTCLCAFGFHLLVERPFLNAPTAAPTLPSA